MTTSGGDRLSVLDPFEVMRLVRLAGAEVSAPDELLVRRILGSIPDTYQHGKEVEPTHESPTTETGVPIEDLVEFWTLLDRNSLPRRRRRGQPG